MDNGGWGGGPGGGIVLVRQTIGPRWDKQLLAVPEPLSMFQKVSAIRLAKRTRPGWRCCARNQRFDMTRYSARNSSTFVGSVLVRTSASSASKVLNPSGCRVDEAVPAWTFPAAKESPPEARLPRSALATLRHPACAGNSSSVKNFLCLDLKAFTIPIQSSESVHHVPLPKRECRV